VKLTALHRYPLKSGAGLSLDRAEVEPRGLAGDRRWLVVDANGRFLTGRQCPRLVLIRAEPEPGGLRLHAPGMPILSLRAPAPGADRITIVIWNDDIDALPVACEAGEWLHRFLGMPARLIYMDEQTLRPVSPTYARPSDIVSFADAFPMLLVSQGALDELNARMLEPVPMLRFRPNIVVDGCAAHAEDGWRRVRIGTIDFDVAKPCTRCVFTTVDPARGVFDESGEPLRTLKTYRRGERGITFGVNLIPRGTGTLRIGDPVAILD
jgi:hypothetical protein